MIPRVLEPEVMDTAEEARDYDTMDHGEVNDRFCDDFASLVGERPIRALDVGTGTARIPILICRKLPGARFVATDLSAQMLEIARRNVESAGLSARIQLAVEDAKAMRFDAGSFDAVISNTILHHIPEPEGAIAEMWRVLGPGGALLVRDLVRPDTNADVAALVAKHGGDPASNAPDDVSGHRRQVALFEASLRAGLRLDELRAILARVGIAESAAKLTSDRHWTLSCVKP